MQNQHIYAISGVKGSGKSTAAKILTSRYRLREVSFAEPIKQMLKLAYPDIPNENLWGDSALREAPLPYRFSGRDPRTGKKMDPIAHGGGWMAEDGTTYPKFLTVRLLLTTLGTEWGRTLDPDIWVRSTLHQRNIVLSDVRFHNEWSGIRSVGGVAIRLNRGLKEARAAKHHHESERWVLEAPDSCFNYIIENENMTPDELAIELGKLAHRCYIPSSL